MSLRVKTKPAIRRQSAGWVVCLLLVVAGTSGCADPQAPEIRDVRISYRTADGEWMPVENVRDGIVRGSPVLVEGSIRDNTAVVDPSLTLLGERQDVGGAGGDPFGGRCRGRPDFYHECELDCSRLVGDVYECDPALPADALIRGDRFVVSLNTDQGDVELEVQVREATRFDDTRTDPLEEYRVLKLANVLGDPNPFLWGLRYRSRKDDRGEWLNEEDLRYGASLRFSAGEAGHGAFGSAGIPLDLVEGEDRWFQLLVRSSVTLQRTTYRLAGPPQVTWKSLVKWNEFFPLRLNPKTGGFSRSFQLFDPRVGPGSKDPEEAAIYTFALHARDVSDQKDDKFRERRETFSVRFVPPDEPEKVPAPELVINELEEAETGSDIEETSTSSYTFTGNVSSLAGEVKSLRFVLSDPDGTGKRVHEVDPETISLTGDFGVNIELVSDWDGRAGNRADPTRGVTNRLEVLAYDVRGNTAVRRHDFRFVPPDNETPPVLSLNEFFPSLGPAGQGLLKARERVHVRAAASDRGSGQPDVFAELCECGPEIELLRPLNESRCRCEPIHWAKEEDAKTDASGRFPAEPWKTIPFEPMAAAPDKNIGILGAKKASGDGARLFTALGVNMVPDESGDAYAVTVSTAVSAGPTNTLMVPRNATILEPDEDLTAQVSVLANVLPVGRLVALYNGERPEDVGLEEAQAPEATLAGPGIYDLVWTVPAGWVKQGTRICLGGESVAGHQTLHLLEFFGVRDGWMVGVSEVTDEGLCTP